MYENRNHPYIFSMTWLYFLDIVPSKRVADILSQLCNELSLDNTFQNKLEVMEGDLTLERLGLTEPNYTALCSHVDVVIHNGAVVNAALPYASMLCSTRTFPCTASSVLTWMCDVCFSPNSKCYS